MQAEDTTQAEEVEIGVTEVDPNEFLEGSAPLEPMQATRSVVEGRAVSRGSKIQRQMRREAKLHQLMPYTLVLNDSDVGQCEIVENEAFPPHERASQEKVCTLRSRSRFIFTLGSSGAINSCLCHGFWTESPNSSFEVQSLDLGSMLMNFRRHVEVNLLEI